MVEVVLTEELVELVLSNFLVLRRMIGALYLVAPVSWIVRHNTTGVGGAEARVKGSRRAAHRTRTGAACDGAADGAWLGACEGAARDACDGIVRTMP
jgi:hypothetical protein